MMSPIFSASPSERTVTGVALAVQNNGLFCASAGAIEITKKDARKEALVARSMVIHQKLK
jgi:hypothetical protein